MIMWIYKVYFDSDSIKILDIEGNKLIEDDLLETFLDNIDIKNIILGAFETKDNSFARLKNKNIKAYKKFRDSRMPLKRYNSAKEIIPVIDFLLEEKSKIISGDIIIDNREKNTFRN